jgi:PKD repeat protein
VVVPGVSGGLLAAGGGAEYSVILVSSGPPPPQDPVASFTAGCAVTSCSFDASASRDPDGTVVAYDWDFGDGVTSSESTSAAHHDYTLTGTYTVSLTVTDNTGATDTTTRQVVAEDTPPPVGPQWRAGTAVDVNSARPSITLPAATQADDRLVLFVSANRAATLTTPTGWTLLSTASDGTEVRSWVFTRAATSTSAGSNLTLTFDATTKAGLAVLAYSGAGVPGAPTSRVETAAATRTHAAPAATVAAGPATVLRYYVDKGATAHTWALSPTLTTRATSTGSGSGFVTVAAGEQSEVAAGSVPALSATSGISSAKAIAWTLVLPPA